MMQWLASLFGARKPTPVAVARPPAVQTGPAPQPAAAPAAAEPAFGQRIPLIDRAGRVAGFEWRLPASLAGRGSEVLAVHHHALVAAAGLCARGGRQSLVLLPAALLSRPSLQARAVAGTMLLPEGGPLAPEVAAELRGRGLLIGVPDGPPAQAPEADFVLLRAAAGGIDTLLLSAQLWLEARPRLPRIAVGLEHIDDIERALAGGITLAGGQFGAGERPRAARPLQAAAHRICALLNDLALDRDTAQVAEAVRGDVALSYRLLRYANSPAIGLPNGVDTVEHAIALLGRVELGRWLSVMLMSAAGGRQASAALQEHALARGRLLEALALRAGEARPQSLFTVGLLSQFDLLLQMPLAAAIESLRLPDEARAALLQRSGPWAVYLELADVLSGDDEALFEALSEPFGGMEAVLAEAEKAWGWAAEVAGTVKA